MDYNTSNIFMNKQIFFTLNTDICQIYLKCPFPYIFVTFSLGATLKPKLGDLARLP